MSTKSFMRRRRLLVVLTTSTFIALALLANAPWKFLRPIVVSAATTFTVNSISDTSDSNTADGVCNDGSGNCTLRAAIEQANALAGTDTINFNIGSGAKTIVQGSAYPTITDPLVIDGTTQPGFAGTPIIEINGNNSSNTCFFITAGSSTIRGLVINRLGVAIVLTTNGNNHIEGNYIGTDITGNTRLANSIGIIINSEANTIGGVTTAARNVISGNNGTGIEMNSGAAVNNVIEGNFIGLNAAGTVALGNSSQGIRLTGSGNRIGGTAPGSGNVVSGNGQDGIEIGGQSTTVQGNFIGTNAAGTAAVPNNDRGIRVFNSPNNVIGGTTTAARNVISGNFAAGLSIEESNSTGTLVQGNLIGTDVNGVSPIPNSPPGVGVPNTSGGVFFKGASNNVIGGAAAGASNKIAYNGGSGIRVAGGINNQFRQNSIFSNLTLGIGLGGGGVTPNDQGDGDTGSNNLQNFPVITSVISAGGNTTVNGNLSSTPSTNYEVEFFASHGCDPSGNGEGARFLESRTVTTDASGNVVFQQTLQSALPAGEAITATARDPNGNTSEFSPCNAADATGSAEFASSTFNVREDLSQLTVPVVRTGGTKGTLTVNFASSNGTATAGQDYTAVSGSVTFLDGEVSKSISIPITNDLVTEPAQNFFVRLSNPTSPDLVGGNALAIITIVDPGTFPILSVIPLTVNEGNTGTSGGLVTVSLSIAVGQTVTVDFQTFEMTATSGVDFQPTSGMLTFAPAVTSQTVPVQVIGDILDEADEMFRIGLSNPVNAGISVSSNPPAVTIIDDDAPPAMSIGDVGVIEGTSGTTDAVFTVTLNAKSGQTVTANFATAEGTATAGSDYQSKNGQVSFNPGEISKTITVLVNGDMTAEPIETFFVNLTSPFGATIADSQGVGSIGAASNAAVQFGALTFNVMELDHAVQIAVTRTGDTSGALTVDFETADGSANARSDYTLSRGTLRFNAGETAQSFTVLVNEDAFIEGSETLFLKLTNPTLGSFILGSNTSPLVIGDSTVSQVNPIDGAQFFVRQHYHDFLNREPDTDGFNFWVGNITECGADPQCIEVKRINVSAAFFLSIEFQDTGYLVYRVYKSAFGNIPSTPVPVVLTDFLRDTQEVGRGVQVGIGDWQAKLEANKQAYLLAFVQRPDFLAAFPNSMTAQQFVDKINTNAGGVLSTQEIADLVALLGGTPADVTKRSQVLRGVAEDNDLKTAETNRAFVLMQYFGYLRRNPNDAPEAGLNFDGYNFWLSKLNQFNGNFIQAEMVKAFISSSEYRKRFGP